MALTKPFSGVLPAMQVPFLEDGGLDEFELRRFASWLAGHQGIGGLVTNGHTGEIFSLSPKERAEVTRIITEEVGLDMPVVSGVSAEGIQEGVEHAVMAKQAGASGLLLMPPHHWLRFGMRPQHVIDYFTAVGEATEVNLVVHVYPAWTKATYSSRLLGQLACLPWVTTFKVGTRDMSQYDRDIQAIRGADPEATVLTCHDEYLLPSMVQGVDGALVGFASFIPETITALWRAVQEGNLQTAQHLHQSIFPLKEIVYGDGEPSGDAHARMKVAMKTAGRLRTDVVRPPISSPTGVSRERIESTVQETGLTGPLS